MGAIMIMFYVNYVYTFVLKKVWDRFNESISFDIILKVFSDTKLNRKQISLTNKMQRLKIINK